MPEPYFSYIKQKRKTVDARQQWMWKGKSLSVCPGAILRYVRHSTDYVHTEVQHHYVKVLSIVTYMTIKELLENEGITNCFPDCSTLNSAVAKYYQHENIGGMRPGGMIALRISPDITDATPIPQPHATSSGGTRTDVLSREEVSLPNHDQHEGQVLHHPDTSFAMGTVTEATVHIAQHNRRSRSRSRQRTE